MARIAPLEDEIALREELAVFLSRRAMPLSRPEAWRNSCR